MDQVLLADWVAGGMKAGRETLVRCLREQVGRSFSRGALGSGGIGRRPQQHRVPRLWGAIDSGSATGLSCRPREHTNPSHEDTR
jgi:hypothetical protein